MRISELGYTVLRSLDSTGYDDALRAATKNGKRRLRLRIDRAKLEKDFSVKLDNRSRSPYESLLLGKWLAGNCATFSP